MHGDHGRSPLAKSFMTIMHAAGVGAAAWLLVGGGANWLAPHLPARGDGAGFRAQAVTLLVLALVYFVRVGVAGRVFLRRAIRWPEALSVGVLLLVLHPLFSALALISAPPSVAVLSIAVLLYGAGSFINSYSEYQRYRYKRARPDGLYTGGLFSLSRHINYFGDVVLFAGYALATGSLWALVVPVVMALSFIFFHAPRLDAYLKQRYGDAYNEWARHTPQLIPWVY